MAVLGAGIVIALHGPRVQAEDRPLQDDVRLHRDTLTVRLVDAPLAEVLQELSRQSDAEIRGQLVDARTVTASFDDVPLAQALARLLPEQNFALVYGGGGRLMAVQLLGAARPVTVVPVAVRRPSWHEALYELIARHSPVPVSGALADALGTDAATLPQLLNAALQQEDPTGRAEAIRAGLGTLQDDAELRAAVLHQLESVDTATLATALGTATGHAEDVAQEVFGAAPVPELRVKASTVLQRLRADAAK
jgi:hypothetical protein